MRSFTRIILKFMPNGIDPEVVEELGVAGGDVTGDALVEPEVPEQAEGGGEALFAVPALVLDVVERGKRHRESVRGHHPS